MSQPLETARVTLEADTQQFQRDWKATLATIAKGTAAVAGLAAGVSLLNRGLKEPTKTLKTLQAGVAAVATGFKGVGAAVRESSAALREGDTARAAASKGYAALRAQLAASRVQLGAFLDEYRKLPKVFSLAGEAVKQSRFELGFFGEILGGVLFAGIGKVASALADRLNPQLEGLAVNAGRVTQTQRRLEASVIEVASAFEAGRQRALDPFNKTLANLIPNLGKTGEILVEQTGFLATLASVGLRTVAFFANLGAKLLTVVGVIKLFNAALQTTVVTKLAEQIGITITATTTLTSAMKQLAGLALSTIVTSVKTLGESLFIAANGARALLAANPALFLAVTAGTAILTAASVAWVTYEKRTRSAVEAQTLAADRAKGAAKVYEEYALILNTFTESEQAAIKGALDLGRAVERQRRELVKGFRLEAGDVEGVAAADQATRDEDYRARRIELLEQEKAIKKDLYGLDRERMLQFVRDAQEELRIQKEIEDSIGQRQAAEAKVTTEIERQTDRYNTLLRAVQAITTASRERIGYEQQMVGVLRDQGAKTSTVLDAMARVRQEAHDEETAARELQLEASRMAADAKTRELKATQAQLEKRKTAAREIEALLADETLREGENIKKLERKLELINEQVAGLEKTEQKQKGELRGAERILEADKRRLQDHLTLGQQINDNAGAQDTFNEKMREANRLAEQNLGHLQAAAGALRARQVQLQAELEDFDRLHAGERQTLALLEARRAIEDKLKDTMVEERQNRLAQIGVERTLLQTTIDTGKGLATHADAVASAEARMQGLAGEAASVRAEIEAIRKGVLPTEAFAAIAAEIDRAKTLKEGKLELDERELSLATSYLDVRRESLSLVDDETTRQKLGLAIERDRLVLEQQLLELERAKAVVVEDAARQKLSAARQTGQDPDTISQYELELREAEIGLKKVAIATDVATKRAQILEAQYERVGTSVVRWGDLMANAAAQGIEAWRTGVGDFKSIMRQFQDALVGSFTDGIAGMLSEKLKFDQYFKVNFLQDLPGIARQGAGMIGQAFSGLSGIFSGGGGGGGFGSVVGQGLAAAGGQGGGGMTFTAPAGDGGGGGWGSLFGYAQNGMQAAQVVNKVSGWFGGGVGGGTQAGGAVVDGVFASPQPLQGPMPDGTALSQNPSSAAGGAATMALMLGIVMALDSLSAGLGAIKQRDSFYDYKQMTKAVGEGFQPWVKTLGNIVAYVGTGHSGENLHKSTLDAISGNGSAHDYVKAIMYGILNPMLFNLAWFMRDLPTKGTVMRKMQEEYLEGNDGSDGIGIFAGHSGMVKRGIGQTGLSANDVHGSDLVQWQRDAIGQGARGIQDENPGMDFVDAQLQLNARLRDASRLTREEMKQVTAYAVAFRAREGKKAGSEATRVPGLIGDFLGSAVNLGARGPEILETAAEAFGGLDRPWITIDRVNEFRRSKDNDISDEQYKDFIQGAAAIAFKGAADGVDVMQVALEELRKTGEVTFDQLEKRITALSQEAAITGPALTNLIDQTLAGVETATVKTGFLSTVRENIANYVLEGFKTGFLQTALKPGLLEPFFATFRTAFEKVREAGNTPEALAKAVDEIKAAGKAAIDNLGGLTPLLDQAIAATQELAKEFDALGNRKLTVGELTAQFSTSLKEGLTEALRSGFDAALGAGTVALGMKGLAVTLGSFVQESVSGALVQALLQSSIMQTALAPLQSVLASAMAQAVAGGITAGTLAGVQSAVATSAQAFATMLEQLKPLFKAVFESVGDIGAMFGGPTLAQRAEQVELNRRMTALQREQALVQRTAQTRISALQRELEIAQQYRAMQDAAQRTIESIQGSQQGGLTVFEQLELTQERLNTALAEFRKPGATVEERGKAAERILELLPLLLSQGASAYQGESNRYAELRDFALKIAEEIRTVGADNSKGIEAKQKELIEIQRRSERELESIRKRMERLNDQMDALNRAIERQAGQITPGPSAGAGYLPAANREALQQSLRSLSPSGDTYRQLGYLRDLTDITSGQAASSAAIREGQAAGLRGAELQEEVQATLGLFHLIQNLFPNLGTDAYAFREVVQAIMAEIRDPSRTSPRLGFSLGGRVPGARGAAVAAIVHGGELVLPERVAAMVTSLPAASALALPTPFGEILGEIQRVAQLSGAREPVEPLGGASPALRVHPAPALTTRYPGAAAARTGARRPRAAGGGITITNAPQITIHVPPGTKLDEQELARRVAAQVEGTLVQSARHGRFRQVLKGTL